MWGQEDYFIPGFKIHIGELTTPDCEAIGMVAPQEYYNRHGVNYTKATDFPAGLEDLFSKYFSLTKEVREVFLSACSLFCNGVDIWARMQSLSFAAFISAIETLVDHEYRSNILYR